MNVRNSWLVHAQLVVLSVLLLSTLGCQLFKKPSVTQPKTEVSWGKAGEAPSAVYTDFDWIIMSQSHFDGVCR